MKLTVLGSGNWNLSTIRHPPAFLVEARTTWILLDCGYGTYRRLAEHECSPNHLTGVCVSHFHGDHMADLVPILDAMVMLEGDKLQPRSIIGPPGLKQRWVDLHRIFCSSDLLSEKILITECPGVGHEFFMAVDGDDEDRIEITPFRVNHVANEISLGFSLWNQGSHITYMGDLNPDQEWDDLLAQAGGANLLIIEAGAKDDSSKSHITARRAIEFGLKCQAEEILLNHIPASYLEEVEAIITQMNADHVRVATDGMKIDV